MTKPNFEDFQLNFLHKNKVDSDLASSCLRTARVLSKERGTSVEQEFAFAFSSLFTMRALNDYHNWLMEELDK
ncbi:MAG: hypothetical protein ACK5KR_09090 [Breznakia sp.]